MKRRAQREKTSRGEIVVGVLVVGAVIAGIVWGVLWMGTHAAGRAQYVHFTSDGRRVVIVDQGRSQNLAMARVRVADTQTGDELGRVGLRSGWHDPDTGAIDRAECYDCIPVAGDHLWCCDMSGDDGLCLRRLDTLAIVADEDRLHSLAPALSQGRQPRHTDLIDHVKPLVDLDDGALLVVGSDGRRYRVGVDLTTRVERPRDVDGRAPTLHSEDLRLPPHAISFEWNGNGLIDAARLDGRRLALADHDAARRTLTVDGQAAPGADPTFLGAGFLADPDLRDLAPVVLADPPGLVLAHVELTRDGRQLVLSRVDRDGRLGWSRALDDEPVRGARLAGGVLVVVLRDELAGLDPATGALRYRHPL